MIMITQSVAANTVNNNLLSGSAFEFSRGRNVVSQGWTESATGMFVTLQSGGDIVAEEFEPPILTRYPIIPDEMYFNDVAEDGDRLVVRARNSTGGALTMRGVVQLTAIR